MTRIKLLLSYDGSSFYGWQKQKVSPLTIQGQVERALSQIFNRSLSIFGSGRTDAGVHALGQVAHCDIPSSPTSSLIRSINSLTPSSITCNRLWSAPSDFHAQRSAIRRSYSYFIFNTRTPPVIHRNFGLWYPKPINLERLNKMAECIVGRHDFQSFQNSGSRVKGTIRTMEQASWSWVKPGLLVFRICGRSFLKQMVRNLVGSQLKWMEKSQASSRFKQVLARRNRSEAEKTAPPQGLFLDCISYPHSLDLKCQKL